MMTVDVEPELLSIEEAGRILRIGRSTAYDMAASGTMPGLIRLGRSLRVSRRRLLEWIDDQTNGGVTLTGVTPQEFSSASSTTPTS
jgi:excisionase family DNA binding protein